MNIYILLRTALNALYRHPVRALLTILGIMIGVAAIIIIFSIGLGAEKKVESQIMAMGENALYIIPGNIVERGRVRSSLSRPPRLKFKDIEALEKQVTDIIEITPGHESLQLIEHGLNATKERVYGTNANVLEINKNKLKKGRFFIQEEVANRSQVAVLGVDLAKKLFKDKDPIGKTIRIEGTALEVIGVLDYVDHFWGTSDPNLRMFVPFTVAKKYFRKEDEVDDDLGFIALSLNPHEKIPGQALRTIKRVLKHMHNIEDDEPEDVTIFDQRSIAASAKEASQTIKLFALIAASFSLLVGGIGIMNIMLVSVQERTREIGLRLALGATQWKIQLQFLIEAVVLSSFGGSIGLVVGILGIYIISGLTDLPVVINFISIFSAFLVTVFIGVFFGYYPAHQASLLDPIEALQEK